MGCLQSTPLPQPGSGRSPGDVGLLAGLPQQVLHLTHDLEAAQRSERVLVIHRGRLSFDGAPRAAVRHYRALMAQEPAGAA